MYSAGETSLFWRYSFIHSAVCLMTGPIPPPKWFLNIGRLKASSFRWEYPLPSLRSSSNFLRLLPLLLVTSISPFIFPLITCRIRQVLRVQVQDHGIKWWLHCHTVGVLVELTNAAEVGSGQDVVKLSHNVVLRMWTQVQRHPDLHSATEENIQTYEGRINRLRMIKLRRRIWAGMYGMNEKSTWKLSSKTWKKQIIRKIWAKMD